MFIWTQFTYCLKIVAFFDSYILSFFRSESSSILPTKCLLLNNMLLLGINFINILFKAFLNESVLFSFSLIKFGFIIFCYKNIVAKAVHKFTTGWISTTFAKNSPAHMERSAKHSQLNFTNTLNSKFQAKIIVHFLKFTFVISF